MSVLVEQAIYGEMKGGHGLRAASAAGALEIASRLDLPDTAPIGAEWSPFVSGFPYGDRYVIARTFRDPNAGRAGMVLSHALIASMEQIITVPDLRPIFSHLITEPAAPHSIPSLNIQCGDETPPAVPELRAAAAALVDRAPGVVVHLGHQGFEALVVSLWGQLWPTIRRTFSFRLSFGPQDLVETPTPVLICTPLSLVARWQNHRLLDRFMSSPQSLASAMISGEDDGETLKLFAKEIGAEISSFAELPLLEQAHRLAVLQPDSNDNSVAAVRLTDRLSPDPSRGTTGKNNILNRLILQIRNASATELLYLRNLTLESFSNGGEVWQTLRERVASDGFLQCRDKGFQNVVRDAVQIGRASDEWRHAVLNGLVHASQKKSKSLASALWHLADADPALTEPLWAHIGLNTLNQDALVQSAPLKLTREAVKPILTYAAKEGLYRLHGATAAASYNPIEAVRLQLNTEPAPGSEGILLALRHATLDQIVDSAFAVDDARLVPIAANVVAKSPDLLANLDMSAERSRIIWSIALDHNPDVWKGPADPRAAFDRVLTDFLDGIDVPSELMTRLASTPLGDIYAFPRRPEVWSKVSDPLRDHLLRATSVGWLRQVESDGVPTLAEAALMEVILRDNNLDELLDRMTNGRIAQAIKIVAVLPLFEEARFRRWLSMVSSVLQFIPTTDAEAIGRLTSERRWSLVAEDLLQLLRRGREDVRPALRPCISLIDQFDRWFWGLTEVTPSEKWELLVEIAAKLYPRGPDQDGLWERAGGHNADLDWAGNGRSRWRDAFKLVRGGKDPAVEELLREMLSDYGGNPQLRFLSNDQEFCGKR